MKLTPGQIRKLRATVVDEVPNRIAAACRIADIQQVDVARGTGLSQQYISDVACGRYTNLTIDSARKFANFFGVLIEDIFPAPAAERISA